MALADFPLVPAASPARVVRVFSEWLTSRRQTRAREIALNQLVSMPEHRLRDLGIDPRQIAGAIEGRHWPTRK